MSTQASINIPETVAEGSPPSEVFIDKSMQDIDSLDANTLAFSSMPSRRTEKLAALFPSTHIRFRTFDVNSKTLHLLSVVLKLDSTFITRMEQVGYVKISIIINRFGMDTRSIAKAFALMGPSHILDPQMYIQTMNFVMFARSQILKMQYTKPDSQPWVKKSAKYNAAFEKWKANRFSDLEDFLTYPSYIILATKEMRLICSKIISWITQDKISVSGSIRTTPLIQPELVPNPP